MLWFINNPKVTERKYKLNYDNIHTLINCTVTII